MKSNWMSMYLPKRLELSFLSVFALPKAYIHIANKSRSAYHTDTQTDEVTHKDKNAHIIL